MAIEVFNRCEKKYLVDEVSYRKLLEAMQNHMVLDAYNKGNDFYEIRNIYYDTEDDRMIRHSIEKPVYKEKLRLRSYGKPSLDDKVYMEMKKKYEDIVNKRRTSIQLGQAYEYLNEGRYPKVFDEKMNMQVFYEIDYTRKFYQLVPKLYLSYQRRAYFDKDDANFRMTFDTNILTRRYDLRLDSDNYGDSLLEPGFYLMEVKANGAVPLWFASALSKLAIYPVSFSKYGAEYKNYCKKNAQEHNNLKGEHSCSNQLLQPPLQIRPSALAHHY